MRPGAFRTAGGTAGAVIGQGPTLILLHGVGVDRGMWQAQIERFAHSHSIVSYDLLGHGESARLGRSASLQDFVRQLDELWRFLGLRRASVVGFSFGGLIAQAFAIEHSARIAKLVLLSTVHGRSAAERAGVMGRLETARREGPAAIYPAALERWFSPGFLAGQPDRVRRLERRMRENDAASFLIAYEVFATADSALVGRLGAIACPTLVMTGERDTGSTPAMAWKMAKEIPGARVSILPGGRHMMPIERAHEVNREIGRFLAEESR